MKNLDIIILNLFVIVCFVTFFISTFRAFEKATNHNDPLFKKRGVISRFLSYLQSLVND